MPFILRQKKVSSKLKLSLTDINSDRDPLLFDEFHAIYQNLEEWYQPIMKLMVLTGLIASELAAITCSHIMECNIMIRESVSRGHRSECKTEYRIRNIRISTEIRKCLDILMARATDDRLFTSPNGQTFNHNMFYKAWVKAENKTQVRYRSLSTKMSHFLCGVGLSCLTVLSRFIGIQRDLRWPTPVSATA